MSASKALQKFVTGGLDEKRESEEERGVSKKKCGFVPFFPGPASGSRKRQRSLLKKKGKKADQFERAAIAFISAAALPDLLPPSELQR